MMGLLLLGFPIYVAWRMVRRIIDFIEVPYSPLLFAKQLLGEACVVGACLLLGWAMMEQW